MRTASPKPQGVWESKLLRSRVTSKTWSKIAWSTRLYGDGSRYELAIPGVHLAEPNIQ